MKNLIISHYKVSQNPKDSKQDIEDKQAEISSYDVRKKVGPWGLLCFRSGEANRAIEKLYLWVVVDHCLAKIDALSKTTSVTQGVNWTHTEIKFLFQKVEHKPQQRKTKLIFDHKIRQTSRRLINNHNHFKN